jgi:hypothetical protein
MPSVPDITNAEHWAVETTFKRTLDSDVTDYVVTMLQIHADKEA